MMHASGAPVPAVGTTTTTNGVSAVPKHRRYSSRSGSESFSSASVVTVKRAGSLSSTGTGARNSSALMRAPSPVETSLIALRVGREQITNEHQRRKSVAVDSTDRPNSEAFDNLNRYSQSSNSGGATGGNTRRSRASSGAVLPNLMNQDISPRKRKNISADRSPRASLLKQQGSRPGSQIQQSPTASPDRERRASRPELANPLNNLSSLYPTPALTDANDTESPSTIRSIATASTQTSYGPDYFVNDSASPQSKAKEQKPAMTRNHTAPMDASRLQPTDATSENEMPNRLSDPQSSRSRELENGDGSVETGGEDVVNSPVRTNGKSKKYRTREKGDREKKAMLSKALQKANTAVLLDNAQNFEGALDAYIDACDLLQQVMDRSSGPDDQRKLDAIKLTYTNRIDELQQLEFGLPESSDEKELPPRPPMSDSSSMPTSPALISPGIDATIDDATAIGMAVADGVPDVLPVQNEDKGFFFGSLSAGMGFSPDEFELPSTSAAYDNVLDKEVFSLESPVGSPRAQANAGSNYFDGQRAAEVSPLRTNLTRLLPAENDSDVPAPLSPIRSGSPTLQNESDLSWMDTTDINGQPQEPVLIRKNSNPWLDTIDERGSSRASSVHSVTSQDELRRKHLRGVSSISNPDFDAAFDAAMETAYNEGLEPDLDAEKREKISAKHAPSGSLMVSGLHVGGAPLSVGQAVAGADHRPDAEDEEEERLLDDFAMDYAQTFNFDMSSKSALPRQSGSSILSRSTWQSSQISDRTTAGTSLSTVAEDAIPLPLSKNAFATSPPMNSFLSERPALPLPPSAPPPQISLPKIPIANQTKVSGVRSRRLSGANMKQLKIETTAKTDARKRASTFHQSSSPFKEDAKEEQPEFNKDFKFGLPLEPMHALDTPQEQSLKSPPSLEIRSAVSDSSRPVTATTEQRESFDDDPGDLHLHAHQPSIITKSKSSVSLREHTVLVASPSLENGPSIATPMSSTFMNFATSTKRNNETPLTSQRATLPSFAGNPADSLYSGGGFLFDTSLSATQLPSSPKSPAFPVGVEPCPESFLLRPFWLMRNIAATLTHPKGGFLTSKLFVSREVWQTRGVKIKNVEDKIANCDLLTAALQRLASVDTFDADAVMEELQGFEDVMERVQNTFVKRLGSDVGISGLPGLFKDATGSNEAPDATAGAEKTKSKESKGGYLNSWRKLRSKSSGPSAINGAQLAKTSTKLSEGESLNMSSVPMTAWVPVHSRGHKRDVKTFMFDGPNKDYMSSLARLCEGVQVLDQIARQVEDPGLKGTSQTHVGLELSIRHAAEFFGFYVCRFVLTDLGLLIDKFVKRGTEWVMT